MFNPQERSQPIGFFACVFVACLLCGIANAAPSINLSKKSGPPTSKILVSGRGFEPNVGVDIFFDTKDKALVVTNGKGEFHDAGIYAPRSARPGDHWVTALERNNDKGAQAPFLVRTNWNQFQFSTDHESVNPYENVLSQEDVVHLNSKWTYGSGEGMVFSTPTVSNGIAYVTAIGLYTVDAETGTLLWSFEAGYSTFFCSPAVLDGVLYVVSPDGYFYALNASTGTVLWQYFGTAYGNTSPAIADGVVYYGGDKTIYALNAKTGALVWSYPTGSSTRSAPAVASGVVYAGSDDGYLYALDAKKGTLRWRAATGPIDSSSPAVVEGAVFVGGYYGTLYALDASTGANLWSFQTSGYIEASPLVSRGLVYLLSNETNLYALNAGTGAVVWKYPLGGQSENLLSLALANDVLYLGYNALYALSPRTGKLLWNSPKLGLGSPAVADGVVYASSFGGLSAFSLKDNGDVRGRQREGASSRPDVNMLRPDFNLKVSKPVTTVSEAER